jgi:hypothetical protein
MDAKIYFHDDGFCSPACAANETCLEKSIVSGDVKITNLHLTVSMQCVSIWYEENEHSKSRFKILRPMDYSLG